MASSTGCRLVREGRSSKPGEPRAASDSRPEILSLRSSADFRRVLSTGVRRKVGDLTVVCAPGESARVRVGLVAGKRTGSAVQRNRAKRRLRSAIVQADLAPGDYVIFAGPTTANVPFASLVEWISEAARRSAR